MNHQINDDPGDRNIHPNRECYAGQFLVLFPVFPEGIIKGHNNHGNHDDREDDVRKKYGKIQSFYPSKLREFRTSMMVMINEVAG